MLGLITTLASIENQPVDSQIELKASTEYLVNTNNIIKMRVYGTTDSELRVKLNKKEDRSPYFLMIVNETNAAIQTLADVSASSNMIALPVFAGAISFSDCTGSTTTKYFNIDDISWVEENNAGTICKLWVEVGGFGLRAFYANYSLAQLYDVLTTGTTTTTTTSTSSTSTSSTSSTSTTSTTTE